MSIGQPSRLSRNAFCYVTNPRGTRMSRVRRFFEKDTRTPKGSPFSSREREEMGGVARSTSRIFPLLPQDGCAISSAWRKLSRIFHFRTLVGYQLFFMHSAFCTQNKNWQILFDNFKTFSQIRSPA